MVKKMLTTVSQSTRWRLKCFEDIYIFEKIWMGRNNKLDFKVVTLITDGCSSYYRILNLIIYMVLSMECMICNMMSHGELMTLRQSQMAWKRGSSSSSKMEKSSSSTILQLAEKERINNKWIGAKTTTHYARACQAWAHGIVTLRASWHQLSCHNKISTPVCFIQFLLCGP